MKKSIVLMTAVISLINVSLLSCSNESDQIIQPSPISPAEVKGNYKGKLLISQGTHTYPSDINFAIADSVVTFTDLPIREIVKSVLIDSAQTETALGMMGPIPYSFHYTSFVSNQNTLEINYSPVPLSIEIPVAGSYKKASITFAAPDKGYYSFAEKSLKFALIAEKITVDSIILNPYDTIKYDFPFSTKN